MQYYRTDSDIINAEIEGFLAFAKLFFDFKVVAAYVMGSYTDNTAMLSSDLDIALVYEHADEQHIDDINEFFKVYSRGLFKVEIDLYLISLDQIEQLDPSQLLTREGVINVKLASQLIAGKDIRDKIILTDLKSYIDLTVETPFHFIHKLRGKNEKGSISKVEYPDKDDYYYGYMNHVQDTHADLETKPILNMVGWVTTSLIAMKCETLIGKKSDVQKLYEEHINDEWAPLIANAYKLIRQDLAYKKPISESEKRALRDLCQELLAYEQYYLDEYASFKKKLTKNM